LLRLEDRCLAKVFSQGNIDGRPALALEYMEGQHLEKFLATRGRLTLSQAKQVFFPMCETLACAHDQGLIHRDLKPSNVFLVEANGVLEPKVLDFGLAKMLSGDGTNALASLTQTGEVLGTPAFMSPEQCLGKAVDGRSDQYALGCLIYQALTGCRAIPGRSAFEAMCNQLSRFPDAMNAICPECKVSAQVEGLIFKLLSKDPDERFASLRDFALEFASAQ
jgi:serine/threonine protein kinase